MSQKQTVLAHLKSGGYITPLTAIGVYGIFRLAARILELRSDGHNIVTTISRDATGRSYSRYSLVAPKLTGTTPTVFVTDNYDLAA